MNLVRRKTTPWIPTLVDGWLQHDGFQAPSFLTNPRPAVNIQETDTAYLLELAAPGFDKKDLTVEVEKDLLSIASEAESTTEPDTHYTRREYSYAAFRRTFSIPENVDSKKIDAQYAEGVLTVTLPKKKEAVQEAKKSIRIR